MKTQDIKNIASAYMQVQEKAKMDPVNPDELKGTHAQRKDKDIDNDGDVDKSDEYLHNRRKAVKTAMKKEEVEEAYSDAHRAKMAKSYKGKNPHHINAMSSDKGTMTIVTNNGNRYTVTAKETGGKMPKTGDHINKWKPGAVKEEVELDEGLMDKVKSGVKKILGKKEKPAASDTLRKGASVFQKSMHFSHHHNLVSAAIDGPKKPNSDGFHAHLGHKAAAHYHSSAADEHHGTPAGEHHEKASEHHHDAHEHLTRYEKTRNEKHLRKAVYHSKQAAQHAALAKKHGGNDSDTPALHKDTEGAYSAYKKMNEEVENLSMREKLQVQKEVIVEREMTAAEKKKREDIVMGMKKNKADLEKRYGSRWKDVMYATATKQAMESVDDALKMTNNLLTTKESFKTETTTWPVYARIKEANDRAMHYKGATPPETMDDKLTASDKAFLAPHGELKGNDSGIDGEKAAEYTAKHATDGIKPGGGMNRTGDQKTGDKNIIKSTQSNVGSKIMDNFVRKIKEAYAEMLEKQNSEISEISQQAKKNYLKKAIGSDKDEPESPSLANLKTARNIPQKYRTSHTSAITSKDKDLDRSIANRKKGIERATGSAKTAQAVSKDVNKAASEFSKEYPDIKKGYSHLSRASKKAGVDK